MSATDTNGIIVNKLTLANNMPFNLSNYGTNVKVELVGSWPVESSIFNVRLLDTDLLLCT